MTRLGRILQALGIVHLHNSVMLTFDDAYLLVRFILEEAIDIFDSPLSLLSTPFPNHASAEIRHLNYFPNMRLEDDRFISFQVAWTTSADSESLDSRHCGRRCRGNNFGASVAAFGADS